MPSATSRPATLLLSLVILLSLRASAQNVKYTENNLDQSMRGSLNVDPSTLGMSFSLSLGNYPGRQINLPVTLSYSSKAWRINHTFNWEDLNGMNTDAVPKFAEHSVSGWTTNLDVPWWDTGREIAAYDASGNPVCLDCDPAPSHAYFIERIYMHMPDGSVHEMRKSDTPVYRDLSTEGAPPVAGVYYSIDGSRMKYDADQWILYLPDGSRYIYWENPQFIDRNGNTLTYSYTTKKWTDTTGRTVGATLDNALSGSSTQKTQYLYLPGFGSHQVFYRLIWKKLHVALGYAGESQMPYDGNKNCATHQQWQPPETFLFSSGNSSEHICGKRFNPVVLTAIVLPTDYQYAFEYNQFGEIVKVTLPTGGYNRYEYGTVPAIDGDQQTDLYRPTNRGVLRHYVCEQGGCGPTQERKWEYTATSLYGGIYQTTVTNPLNARSERLHHAASNSPGFGLEDPRFGSAFEERVYSSANQMLRRSLSEWTVTWIPITQPVTANAPRDPRLTKKVDLLLDPPVGGQPLASTSTFEYDGDLNRTVGRDYDFVTVDSSTAQNGAIGSMPTGSLLRSEETTWLVNDTAIADRADYRARHIISLPSHARVKDAGGAIVAETRFQYDGNPPPAYANPPVNWVDPATDWTIPANSRSKRGNVTTVKRWLNMNGSAVVAYPADPNSATFISTQVQYDQAGNPRFVTDGRGHVSETRYNDAFSDSVNRNTYAYATATLTPQPDPTGQYGSSTPLTSSMAVEFQSGKPVSTTDPNNQTTSYSYGIMGSSTIDYFVRLGKVTLPNSLGETMYEYGDAPGSLYLHTLTRQDATNWIEDYLYFDGMGRAWRKGHKESATQWSVTDSEYDEMGRVKRVSNPYLASNLSGGINPSGLWTTTAYDDVNRALTVATPDGAVVSTSYNLSAVTVTDPAGRKRKSQTDALGRLTSVVEDPGGPKNYQTAYTYDELGNLTVVNQGGQYRYFFHDSLSRLARASNPEQETNAALALTNGPAYNNDWSLAYAYDANGNLLTRTDSRGAGGIATTYGYDRLNRNIAVSYNDGATPAAERHYDGAIANGKGRLHYHVNYPLDPATGGYGYSRTVVTGYDALGRVTGQSQGFLNSAGTLWIDFPASRTYDQAGHVLSQGYPSGSSVNYTHGADGRLTAFGGNLRGTALTYADNILYNAAGLMIQERFGTQTALYHQIDFNRRWQIEGVRLGTSGGAPSVPTSYNRGKLTFAWGATPATNNGNLYEQTHYVPTAGGYVQTRAQYSYDELNRVTGMTEWQSGTGLPQSQIASQAFAYDRWGNRLSVTGLGAQSWDATEASLTNRLKLPSGNQCTGNRHGLCYDRAGNLIFDNQLGANGERTYDAENRLVSAVGGGLNKYVYDADGRRVRRLIGAQQFWQVYGIDGELLAEYLWNGTTATILKEYGYRNGDLLVVAEGEGTATWLVKDHLGTPRMNVARSGAIGKRHDYLPFGEENLAGSVRSAANGYGVDSVRQKFTGKERDSETGLDFFDARYYGSSQGRFTSPDPLSFWMLEVEKQPEYIANPQRWNKYVYVLNNPLRYVDPTGLIEIPVWDKLPEDFRKDLEKRGVNRSHWNKWSSDQRQEVMNMRAVLMQSGVWNNVTSVTFGIFTVKDNWGPTNTVNFIPGVDGWALAITTDKDIRPDLLKAGFKSESPTWNHPEGDWTYKQEGDSFVLHLVGLQKPAGKYITAHFDSGGGKIWNKDHWDEYRGNRTFTQDDRTRYLGTTPAAKYLKGIAPEIDKLLVQNQKK